MVTYEECEKILHVILDMLNIDERKNIIDALPTNKIKLFISNITEYESLGYDYGSSFIDGDEMVIFVNFCKIYKEIKESKKQIKEDAVDSFVRIQLVVALLHEICHHLIPTDSNLYDSDEKYHEDIENKVNNLASDILKDITIELSKLTNVPILKFAIE